MLGQNKTNIEVVPYQSVWKELYDRKANLLHKSLGEKALCIEHIGRTAIPGMVLKPIIDIMVAVVSLTQATELIQLVEALGYKYRTPDTVAERMFFVKEQSPEYRTHHLNLTAQDSGFWKNQLAFRDYLWTHDKIAGAYGDLKKRMAELYALTQQLDPDGKSEFVARLLELAEKEERETN